MYDLPIHHLSQLFIHRLSLLPTYHLSIGLSLPSITDQPIYLHYHLSIYHFYQSSHPSTIYPYIYPPIQPSVYNVSLSIHPSLLPISTINLCNLSPIHLPVSTTYLSICHLPNIPIYLCISLFVYFYIYLCVYSCGSQLEMTMPLRGRMTRHGDIFYCQN